MFPQGIRKHSTVFFLYFYISLSSVFSVYTLLVGIQSGIVICLERGANNLHMVQPMPGHPVISCLIKIQNGFVFLVPAYPVCPRKVTVKRMFVVLLHLSENIRSSVSQPESTLYTVNFNLLPDSSLVAVLVTFSFSSDNNTM